MNRRVVVTGLGAITPSGLSADELWHSVVAGHSGISRLDDERFSQLPVRIGGVVTGFDAEEHMTRQIARRLTPVQHWSIAAAAEALRHADAEQIPWDPARTAVIAATGSGPIDAMQAATRVLDAEGPRRVPLTLSMHGGPDGAAAVLTQLHGIRGPAQAVSATCASSGIAIGESMRRIRHGYADAALVVGAEDCLNPVNLASNANLRALATGFEDAPHAASRPFDRQRSGFVMSQGAAALVLESADSAAARGVRPLATVAGFGAASDAHHATAPHPEGRGAAQAVRDALADAGVTPGDVEHVNAHGTGTPAGDTAELLALEAALGEHVRTVPVTATKSSTGHLLGAAGAVEAVVAIRTLTSGIVPPTINLVDPEAAG